MIFGKIRFKSLIAYLAAITVIVITCALGFWQLERAKQKDAQQTKMSAKENLPVQLLTPHHGNQNDMLFRHLKVKGYWLSDASLYLDNRADHRGRPGIEVITPLCLSSENETPNSLELQTNLLTSAATMDKHKSCRSDNKVLLIKRGWLPSNPLNRQVITPFATTNEAVEITGLARPNFDRVYALGEEASPQKARLRQNITIDEYAQAFSFTAYPFILQQTSAANDGLQRPWLAMATPGQNPIQKSIARHYGYAFQWFSLAALTSILMLYFFGRSYLLRQRTLSTS